MKKILYVVPVLVIVLLGFKLKVRAASEYYIHTDGYVYWMPDYTNFNTNNGLFKFSDFYECADDSGGIGQYFYEVNAYFSSGDVRKVEIYQDGGWYPLDSYKISNTDWTIDYNADINDTGYKIITGDFNFFYQISDNTLTDDDLAGIRFYYGEPSGQNEIKFNLWELSWEYEYTYNNHYRFIVNQFLTQDLSYMNARVDNFKFKLDSIDSISRFFTISSKTKRLILQVEKVIIDSQNGDTLVDKLISYLEGEQIQGYFKLAVSERSERQDLIYNVNLMNYPDGGALYDPSAYSSYNMFSQYLSVRFKSIDLEKIILMNNGVMPEIIFKVNGVENNFYPYDEFKLTMPEDKKIRDRVFLFNIHTVYYNDLYMAFNFRYPEYLNEYHQYMLDKAEVDIRKLQISIIFKDVLVEDEMDISEMIQQAYNRGYSDGLTIGYEDAFNAGYDEGKRIGDILQYQYGYDAGYEDGLVTGNEDVYNSGYDAGFTVGAQESEAYNVGYADGANESFFGSMDKWLVPSIIIVMLLGGFFAIARKKRDGDI